MTMAADPLERLSLDDLRGRTSIKWRSHPADVLPLWVAEMDVQLAEPIAGALIRAVEQGDTGYPSGEGFAQAVGGFAAREWGWDGLAVDRTAVVPDVMAGIVEMMRLVTQPGAAVVVNTPVYPPFFPFLEHGGWRVVEAPLAPDGRLDLDAVEAAFAGAASGVRPQAYLLCNPHNPTGVVHTAAELAAVAVLADRYRVRVVADEIHAPLTMPGQAFTPYLSVPGADDALSVLSASKGWNLSGLKCALAIAGPAAAGDLARLPEEVSHGPSHLGVIAHIAAFRDAGAWLATLRDSLRRSSLLLDGLLARHLPAIRYTPPQATYLAWLGCHDLGLPAGTAGDGAAAERGLVRSRHGPAGFFLDHARVALNAGTPFGGVGTRHVRLNFATSRDILTEAVTRMGRAVRAAAAREA
jgi:cystathionine beta-lyase